MFLPQVLKYNHVWKLNVAQKFFLSQMFTYDRSLINNRLQHKLLTYALVVDLPHWGLLSE